MNTTQTLFPQLHEYLPTIEKEFDHISAERKERLLEIATYIKERHAVGAVAELNFICTHNSRRSHLGQIWAKTLAEFYGVANLKTYSGGTEATAFNPNAIEALRTVGFSIETTDETPNPHYTVTYGETAEAMEAWSKVYSDPANPASDFCAIMTCTEADGACPLVLGAIARVSLPFVDPKVSDGTPQQAATYLARSRQIAGELAFVFKSLAV